MKKLFTFLFLISTKASFAYGVEVPAPHHYEGMVIIRDSSIPNIADVGTNITLATFVDADDDLDNMDNSPAVDFGKHLSHKLHIITCSGIKYNFNKKIAWRFLFNSTVSKKAFEKTSIFNFRSSSYSNDNIVYSCCQSFLNVFRI